MAQTLYYNGTILTMEDRCPQVEAVLTEDGRILETGTWEKVKERAGDKARRLDLQGRVMMPGFIDSHSHFTACASHTMEVDLGGAGSFEDMIICGNTLKIRRFQRENGSLRPDMTTTA